MKCFRQRMSHFACHISSFVSFPCMTLRAWPLACRVSEFSTCRGWNAPTARSHRAVDDPLYCLEAFRGYSRKWSHGRNPAAGLKQSRGRNPSSPYRTNFLFFAQVVSFFLSSSFGSYPRLNRKRPLFGRRAPIRSQPALIVTKRRYGRVLS